MKLPLHPRECLQQTYVGHGHNSCCFATGNFLAVGVPQYVTIDLGGHLGDSDMQLEVNWVVRPQVSPYLQVLQHNLNYFKAPQ